MSDYREEVNKYKAKRIGQTDAKVVAPKGKKKNVDKPWVVWAKFSVNTDWKPWKHEFQHEHDARAYLAKMQRSWAKDSWLEHNGVRED
jgi:hypothetical protein